MEIIYFVYIDSKLNVSAFALKNPSYTDIYFQGFSPSAHGYRTFRRDRLIESFDSFEEAQAHAEFIAPTLDTTLYSPQKTRCTTGAFEVCFTGFKKSDKERLMNKALEANMIVRTDVTVNLHFLCFGYNAGPKKMELARMKGTTVLDEQQFISLIETGELPDV